MALITLQVNSKSHEIDIDENTPLLWVLRDELNMTGTKYGCGVASCGACSVIVDGEPVRSCSYTVASAAGKTITTIEGIGGLGELGSLDYL